MKSQRLDIRESIFDDLECFSKWEREPQVTKFFTIDDGKTYEMIVREFYEWKDDKTKKQFTICMADTGIPIGRIYISRIDRKYDSLDITRIYIADTEMRGKGYGEEALKAILKWAFEDMNCERVTLDHFNDNMIAAALYEKVGFVREGVMRHGVKKNGKYVDLCLMAMLRKEYFRVG